jgi:hypothetical protein
MYIRVRVLKFKMDAKTLIITQFSDLDIFLISGI